MTAAAPALSSASRRARLVRAFLRGGPVQCTWQLSPRCESFCHRGRMTKCVEFRGAADEAGALPADPAERVRARLQAAHAANQCRACWYSSRAEIEALYTVSGFIAGLGTLVTA